MEVDDMVGYELTGLDDKKVTYNYYPENDLNNRGVISFDRKNNKPFVASRAVDDEYGFYSIHMFNMLRKSNETGNFEKTGYVAWY